MPESNQPKIVIARTDDWVGLYINGKLATENHSIDLQYALTKVGIPVDVRYFSDMQMYMMGEAFPEDVEDLPSPQG